MKTKLQSVWLAFDENRGVRTLHLQPLIRGMRSDSHLVLEEKKVGGRDEMVISIDYLCAYDPVVSPCIPKSTQIIGFTNFMLREKQLGKMPPRRPPRPPGSHEITVKGSETRICAEAWANHGGLCKG